MNSGVNHILQIYLGTEGTGGYQPIGCEERLRRAYPADHAHKRKEIEQYLDEDHAPDWSKRDLTQECDLLAAKLRTKFPQLDDISVRALVNRFAYSWK